MPQTRERPCRLPHCGCSAGALFVAWAIQRIALVSRADVLFRDGRTSAALFACGRWERCADSAFRYRKSHEMYQGSLMFLENRPVQTNLMDI